MYSSPIANDASVHGRRSRRVTIGLYAACAFLYWVSLYLYVPTLPTFAQTKTGNLAIVGTVLAMYGLWQAVVRLPLGIAIDWIGRRKPFIVVGLLLAGLGAGIMGATDGVSGLIVGRSITGIAAAAWVPLLVAFNSLFPADEAVTATAILTFVNTGGRVLATSATGALNARSGYALPFYLAAAVAVLAALFVLPTQERVHAGPRPSWAAVGHLMVRQDVFVPSLLAAASQYANWATTFAFTPILARQLGGSDVTESLLVSVNLLIVMLGSLCATPLTRRFGTRALAICSFCMLAAGVGLTAVAASIPMLFAIQLLIGLSQGVNIPLLMGTSIRYVGESERNTAMGLHQAVYAVGMFCGPWLSGILAQGMGIRPMLGATAIATLVLGLGIGTRLMADSRR